MPHIVGQTIYLREYLASDLEAINNWRKLDEIVSWTGVYIWPESIEETKAFLDAQLNNIDPANRKFAICRKDDDRYLGHIGYEHLDLGRRNTELGIVIGNLESLSKGIGTEAIKLFLKVCFDEMGLHRVGLRVMDYNDRGRRCYEKCGFKQEGVHREYHHTHGRWHDQILMSILEHEYRAMVSDNSQAP